MITDALEVPDGSVLTSDVCIVGAGPAGLTLARELSGHSYHVCLLEAGPDNFDRSHSGYADLYPPADSLSPRSKSRWGALGGTASIWNTFIRGEPTARYLWLDELDFERRAWLPFSGWPFDRSALAPYYLRAESTCMPGLSPHLLPKPRDTIRAMPLDANVITTTLERFGRANVFTRQIPSELSRRSEITILINATAFHVQCGETPQVVDRLLLYSAPGRASFSVTARLYVLAAGGIENARLLLESNQTHGNPLGNAYGLVGRFFMDHQRLNGGALIPCGASSYDRASLYDIQSVAGQPTHEKLTIARETLSREHLLSNATDVWPVRSTQDELAVNSLKSLARAVRCGRLSHSSVLDVRNAVAGRWFLLGASLRFALRRPIVSAIAPQVGLSRLANASHRFRKATVIHQFEQAPDPENRVILSHVRDQFGRSRACVQTHFTELDLISFRRAPQILARHLEERGIARIKTDPTVAFPDLQEVGGVHHHLGTTRMHIDPKKGVVDPDCLVHGMRNLYVCGSSVFPTGGYANPTLTIVALAIRLADHLKAGLNKRID